MGGRTHVAGLMAAADSPLKQGKINYASTPCTFTLMILFLQLWKRAGCFEPCEFGIKLQLTGDFAPLLLGNVTFNEYRSFIGLLGHMLMFVGGVRWRQDLYVPPLRSKFSRWSTWRSSNSDDLPSHAPSGSAALVPDPDHACW
jgi:hypothetical protein